MVRVLLVFLMYLQVTIGAGEADLKQLEKAELHLHLGGSFTKEYLYTLASEQQKVELEEMLSSVANRVDYHKAFGVFKIIANLVNTEEKIQRGVESLCDALIADNVTYVEIRTGLKDLGKGYEAYLQAVLDGIKAKRSDKFEAKVLLSLQRYASLEMARLTVDMVEKYREAGVIGLDISGNSTIGNVELIMPELLRAKEVGIPFVVHVGESPRETGQLEILEALEPDRIGHGVHLTDEAVEWIKENKTPIEICLTSGLLVQMVDEYHEHPGIGFFREGHPVVFCTDDPLLFSTTLTQELMHAHKSCGLTIEELTKITKDSFKFRL